MIYSKKLSQFKNLIHGFTTREDGDFREERGLTKTAQKISRSQTIARLCDTGCDKLMLPKQVHGDKITVVAKKSKEKVIRGVDGLITEEKGIVLGITTADCLPILFYEPRQKIVGVVHAGWKGSLKRITQKTIKKINQLGGKLGRLLVVIGPHIKVCCYEIDRKRASKFENAFGRQVVSKKKGKIFLDLTKVNLIELLESGVNQENIETLPFCTACDENFFSYRKDKENYGEMLSFISMLNESDEL